MYIDSIIHTVILYLIFIFAPGVFVGEDCEARRALDADEVVGDDLQHHPPLVHVHGLQVQTWQHRLVQLSQSHFLTCDQC